jgi:hypothetical protein
VQKHDKGEILKSNILQDKLYDGINLNVRDISLEKGERHGYGATCES